MAPHAATIARQPRGRVEAIVGDERFGKKK
jgi:hypothetical protein